MLIRETPGNEEVGRALFDAQVQLKKRRGEDIKDLNFGSNLIFITSNERFRHFITSPGKASGLVCFPVHPLASFGFGDTRTLDHKKRYVLQMTGMSVVLFCKKTNHKQVLHVLEQVCKKFPSIHFLKVCTRYPNSSLPLFFSTSF